MSPKKIAALFLALVMVLGLTACTTASSVPPSTTTPVTTAPNVEATQGGQDTPEDVYPIPGNKKLTYWCSLDVSNWNDNNANLPKYKKLMELTGVTIEYIHPVVGQVKEGFNLMVASRVYPDIIESKEENAGKLLDDGVIIDLTDILPKWSPALWSYLQANENVAKQVKNDDGQYLLYPFIRPDPLLQVSSGPIIRADWLKALNMEAPVTIDEWHTMLTGFKSLGATAPLSVEGSTNAFNRINRMMYAWDCHEGFTNNNGTVEYGFLAPGYRGYLETMSQWYAEGLIDPDYLTNTRAILDANMLSGKSGATDQSGGGGLGVWMTAAPDETYDLIGISYPVLNKGDTVFDINRSFEFANTNSWGMISTQCKDVETAAKLLDFGYTEAGHILFNFGIEGESYTVVNGEYIYTPEMFTNETMSISDTLGFYVRATGSGLFLQDPGYILQYYQLEQQKQSLRNWLNVENRGERMNMPPVVLTADESSEYSSIKADVDTLIREEQAKFILGTRSMDTFDAFIDQIKSYNVDRLIDIQQKALDRFNAR